MKRKNETISIDQDYLLNEMIWPATRYCIGRHSYVSGYARDYLSTILKNWDKFNENRVLFYARDIMTEISNSMNWWDNVKTENSYNDIIKYDSHFLLCRYLAEHPEVKFESNKFTIDCLTGEVTSKPWEKSTDRTYYTHSFPDHDLSQWSKLANALYNSFTIKYKNPESDKSYIARVYLDYGFYQGEWTRYFMIRERWDSFVPEDWIILEGDKSE